MNLKHWLNIFHMTVNLNSIVHHAIQINDGTMINVKASEKSIVCVKMIIVTTHHMYM